MSTKQSLSPNEWQFRITILLAVLILIPSGYGFIGKFIELINVAKGEAGGAFAVAPIMNYLLASLGFLCLLLWAAGRGMFRDIENPKRQMLEREAELDARSAQASFVPARKHN
jgi:hypothetical protein